MRDLIARTCWPSRFLMYLFSIFSCAMIAGMVLAVVTRKSPPPPAPPTKTVPPRFRASYVFSAYDARGKSIKAVLVQKDAKRTRTPLEDITSRLTQDEHTTINLTFQLANGSQEVTRPVVWMSSTAYKKWLEGEFLDSIKNDPDYNKQKWASLLSEFEGRIGGATYDYPIVFPSNLPKAHPGH